MGKNIFDNKWESIYFLIVSMFSLIFYGISINIVFLSYKEFKGIAYDILKNSNSEFGFDFI